jgi:hypothetical protein
VEEEVSVLWEDSLANLAGEGEVLGEGTNMLLHPYFGSLKASRASGAFNLKLWYRP